MYVKGVRKVYAHRKSIVNNELQLRSILGFRVVDDGDDFGRDGTRSKKLEIKRENENKHGVAETF